MNEILEKAKRDYPIGTKFRSMYVNSENVVTKPIFIQHESIYTTDDNFKWITIYDKSDNKWAEIIKEETMFKKGDYIVTLINDGDCGKVNYCSKQNEDIEYLCPEIDTKGIKNNGNSTFKFSDKSGLKWRFATKEEGEEYERQGKPYNVGTLLSSLILNDLFDLITRDVSTANIAKIHRDECGNTHAYPLTPKEAYPNYSLPVPTNIILKTKSKSIKL